MSWVRGHFDLPVTPDGTQMPHVAQTVATSAMAVLVAGFVVYAVLEIFRKRSLTLALLLVGGAISYFNEPIDDVLGLVWHPVVGQWTAIDTFARVPLWGLGIYIVFFGGMPYVILQALRRGLTRRQLWGWVGVLAVVDVVVELPILASGIYYYYGNPPLQIGGFPVFWIVINTVGPLGLAVLLLATGDTFSGWRALYLPFLPMMFDAAGSVAVGWPIFSALNANASTPVRWLAAALTIAIGIATLDLLIGYVTRTSVAQDRTRAVAAHHVPQL
jgi:hypothetical protein